MINDSALILELQERITTLKAERDEFKNRNDDLWRRLAGALRKVSAVHGFAVEGDLDRVLTMANAAGAAYGGSDAAASETWWSVVLHEWAIYTGNAAREAKGPTGEVSE